MLQITKLDTSSVMLAWDGESRVDIYEVQLFAGSSISNRTNTTSPALQFVGLGAGSEYSTRVIAFNAAGSSPPSFNMSFSTLPEKDVGGERPQAPKGVKIAWNRGSTVNITWDAVTMRTSGDDVHGVVEYTLSFVDTENSGKWQTVSSFH